MAIGRKGSRRIVVDGTTYRWRLRRPDLQPGALTVTLHVRTRLRQPSS